MTDLKNIDKLSPEEKRELLKKILKKKANKKDASKSAPEDTKLKKSFFQLPTDFQNFKKNHEKLFELCGGNIYFQPAEGINNNLTRINGKDFINYSGYNYLGMSGDPLVSKAAKEAIDKYGTSVSASRLASGERPLHRELEEKIAGFLGTEDSVVFVGGYAANETVISHLFNPGDLVLYDSFSHMSIQRGAQGSGAKLQAFPHNNWQALDRILSEKRDQYKQVLIVIEGVYSMDGDIPDLPRFIEVKNKRRACLMVDEAHSIGTLGKTGRGIGEFYNVDRQEVDLWMGTLSKSFAGCGGYIAGMDELILYIKATTPGFVFSVGMPPSNAAAALASFQVLEKEPERVARLRERAGLFLESVKTHGVNTGLSQDSAVVPVITGDSLSCFQLYNELCQKGIFAMPMVYPTVPENAARLRFFITSDHTEEQLRFTANAIAEGLMNIEK